MHRHCFRSTLLQCAESGSASPLHAIQHHSFSTSALVSTGAKPTVNKVPKASPQPKVSYPKVRQLDGELPERREKPRRKKLHQPPPERYDPRMYYQNKASVDRGPSKNERYNPNAPTPLLFISRAPIITNLAEAAKQSFVVGETPEIQEGDTQLEEELSLSGTLSPGAFVELRRCVSKRPV